MDMDARISNNDPTTSSIQSNLHLLSFSTTLLLQQQLTHLAGSPYSSRRSMVCLDTGFAAAFSSAALRLAAAFAALPAAERDAKTAAAVERSAALFDKYSAAVTPQKKDPKIAANARKSPFALTEAEGYVHDSARASTATAAARPARRPTWCSSTSTRSRATRRSR